MQAVDLVDEEHVVRVERHEDAGQVTRFVEHGAGSRLEAHAEFIGDDVGEGCLAQARGAVEQGVVERLAAHTRRPDEDTEIVYYLVLTREVAERQRAQRLLDVFFGPFGPVLVLPDVKIFCHNAKLQNIYHMAKAGDDGRGRRSRNIKVTKR